MEFKTASTEAMAEKYEMRCQDLQRAIESLKRGISSTYDRLEVSNIQEDVNDDDTGIYIYMLIKCVYLYIYMLIRYVC